ncbi:hypothetical protein NO559_15655, partial [Dasania sp. GY-MA-18]
MVRIHSVVPNKKGSPKGWAFFIWLSRPEIGLHIEDLLMDNSTPKRRKRTQRDYNLGFKLAVVEQI